MYIGGVSFLGDEDAALETLREVDIIGLANIVRSLKTSAGLPRFEKVFDTPNGGTIRVVDYDHFRHIYIHVPPVEVEGGGVVSEEEKEDAEIWFILLPYQADIDTVWQEIPDQYGLGYYGEGGNGVLWGDYPELLLGNDGAIFARGSERAEYGLDDTAFYYSSWVNPYTAQAVSWIANSLRWGDEFYTTPVEAHVIAGWVYNDLLYAFCRDGVLYGFVDDTYVVLDQISGVSYSEYSNYPSQLYVPFISPNGRRVIVLVQENDNADTYAVGKRIEFYIEDDGTILITDTPNGIAQNLTLAGTNYYPEQIPGLGIYNFSGAFDTIREEVIGIKYDYPDTEAEADSYEELIFEIEIHQTYSKEYNFAELLPGNDKYVNIGERYRRLDSHWHIESETHRLKGVINREIFKYTTNSSVTGQFYVAAAFVPTLPSTSPWYVVKIQDGLPGHLDEIGETAEFNYHLVSTTTLEGVTYASIELSTDSWIEKPWIERYVPATHFIDKIWSYEVTDIEEWYDPFWPGWFLQVSYDRTITQDTDNDPAAHYASEAVAGYFDGGIQTTLYPAQTAVDPGSAIYDDWERFLTSYQPALSNNAFLGVRNIHHRKFRYGDFDRRYVPVHSPHQGTSLRYNDIKFVSLYDVLYMLDDNDLGQTMFVNMSVAQTGDTPEDIADFVAPSQYEVDKTAFYITAILRRYD